MCEWSVHISWTVSVKAGLMRTVHKVNITELHVRGKYNTGGHAIFLVFSEICQLPCVNGACNVNTGFCDCNSGYTGLSCAEGEIFYSVCLNYICTRTRKLYM